MGGSGGDIGEGSGTKHCLPETQSCITLSFHGDYIKKESNLKNFKRQSHKPSTQSPPTLLQPEWVAMLVPPLCTSAPRPLQEERGLEAGSRPEAPFWPCPLSRNQTGLTVRGELRPGRHRGESCLSVWFLGLSGHEHSTEAPAGRAGQRGKALVKVLDSPAPALLGLVGWSTHRDGARPAQAQADSRVQSCGPDPVAE